WKKGDRVYVFADNSGQPRSGSYSDHLVCAASHVSRLPNNVSYAQGAAIGVPYATTMYALHKLAAAKPGETMLVHGASGGVGIGSVQAAKALGMRVIGTAGTKAGVMAVTAAGADSVVNHHDDGYVDQILRATQGRGVNVVFEMNAHLNLDKDLTLLARGGRVVLIGNRGRIDIDPRAIMAREAAVLGMVLFNVAAAEFVWMHAAIGAGLANGSLAPLVGREFALAEAPQAHEAVMEPGALGKIVLVP
ncbi:MAG: NADPH:quinone reductase, partial [Vicinamibacterales bacterium]